MIKSKSIQLQTGSVMLLPKYWLRQHRLRRALVDYPIYDPPHKIEERLLPTDKALENFQYFIDVRKDRVAFFRNWLFRQFGVDTNFEQNDLEKAFDWADDYIPIIMPWYDFWPSCQVFATCANPWTGKYAGANAYFDFGATLGEAIIHHRHNLRWQMEWKLSDYPNAAQTLSRETMVMLNCRERDNSQLKREECSGYRRPLLASAHEPVAYEPVYDFLNTYTGTVFGPATIKYTIKTLDRPKAARFKKSSYLRDWFTNALTPPSNPKH